MASKSEGNELTSIEGRLQLVRDAAELISMATGSAMPRIVVEETRVGGMDVPVNMMQESGSLFGSKNLILRISPEALNNHSDSALSFQVTFAVLWFTRLRKYLLAFMSITMPITAALFLVYLFLRLPFQYLLLGIPLVIVEGVSIAMLARKLRRKLIVETISVTGDVAGALEVLESRRLAQLGKSRW